MSIFVNEKSDAERRAYYRRARVARDIQIVSGAHAVAEALAAQFGETLDDDVQANIDEQLASI